MDETYCFTKYEKFDFPITALYGDQDQDSEIDTVEAWSEYTNTSFNKKVFHGEHFLLKHQKRKYWPILRTLSRGMFKSERVFDDKFVVKLF